MFFRKKRKYFLKLSGIALMAVVALVFAAVIFFLLLPHILAVTMVFVVIILIFIMIWMLVYIAMVLGANVYRYALPMQMEEKKSGGKR